MAKKIALELQIGGVKQSVSSIQDLEKAIKGAREQLKGVEIGSDEFKRLSGEIRKAQNFAEDLNESLKPQELEKRVGAYAKVGSAIVSSFAAAQSALSLFGNESEDIAKAAAKAQGVLTLALTAREIAEGAVAVKTVALNIATIAQTAATNAATVATRILYTVIAANPLTALALAVGTVVTALYAMGSSQEEVIDQQKELNKVVSETAVELKAQSKILMDGNTGEQTRLNIIEQLKKEYPGFNAFIDEENKLTQQGADFIAYKIEQLKSEARIKVILQKLTEAEKKGLELSTQEVEKQIGLWDELWGAIRAVGTLSPGESARVRAIREQTEALIANGKEQNQLNELLKIEEDRLAFVTQQMKQYEDTMRKQVEFDKQSQQAKEDLTKKLQELSKAYKDGLTSQIDFKLAVEQLDKETQKYIKTLERLGKGVPTSTTLQEIENFKKFRKELLDTQRPLEVFQEKFQNIPKLPRESFENLFKDIRRGFESIKSASLPVEETLKRYNQLYNDFIEQNQNLSTGQKEVIFNLLQGYNKFEQKIQETPGLKKLIENQKTVQTQFQKGLGFDKALKGAEQTLFIFGELGLATGKLTTDFDNLGNLIQIAFDPNEVEKNVKEYRDTLEKDLFVPIGEDLLKVQLEALEFQQSLFKPNTTEYEKLRGQIDQLKVTISNFQKGIVSDSLSKTIQERVKKEVDGYIELGLAIVSYEEQVLSTANKVDQALKNTTDSIEEASKAAGIFIQQNLGNISQALFGPLNKSQRDREKFRKDAEKDFIGLSNFYFKLVENPQTRGAALQIKNMKDLLDAYTDYKMMEVQATEDAENEKDEILKQNLQKVQQRIQLFSSTLTQIASLSADSIRTQLEFLEKSYKKQSDMVVGDTESANNKRLELQREYEQKRAEIEKKGRLTALRFSLAQAIANGAQAITGIIAQYAAIPGGQIIAGIQSAIVAGLTAAEVAIINEQINTVSMFRRGGLLKAQGGMLLSGPSHERGGIPLAQMGVVAEGQEAIINRNSLVNFRDLLSTINQSGGGRPLVVNTFDDSRIVEAIAEQKQKPLRAYVLQSEITNEQALSKRLDDLSKI